jgi:hypothetical protein
MPRGRPKKKAVVEETSSERLKSPEITNTTVDEDIRIIGESKTIYSMSDGELCTAVWRGIIREYLTDGKHSSMILKASELLAKTAGCLYGGGTNTTGDGTPMFINDIEEIEEVIE